MKFESGSLNELAEKVPAFNSSSCYSELDSVLAKYINILNSVSNTNTELKRQTNLYYNDISEIRNELQVSLYSNKHTKKVAAFENAANNLKTNILALAFLIEPKFENSEALA